MNQTGNSSTPSQIADNNNFQQTSNVNMPNTNSTILHDNTVAPPQNTTFEFYLPLPNDTRVYYVTYTELDSLEIARRLNNGMNNGMNISPFHYNIQSLIHQLIHQIQQQNIQQQSFDNISQMSQMYVDNNAHNTASVETISVDNHDMQDAGTNPNNNDRY
ncbi:hypothetical protein C1645_314545 [Glomus cerebriforme]|uniref:Uncharacterized protein n=1 Tax=Glomus cerebriforme TaxID=658196 RepID=A0A397TIC2_9GLOM|nr:hypothetical protein C1645_314545 [Glomus cerebriforme]